MLELEATHRDIQLPGLRMHIAEAGEGEPLLLLHGWPQDGYMWRKVLAPLAAEYRVIVPDLRGFGRSEAPPGAYAKRTLAADVLALLDELGLERTRVVGHDWGGWVTWLLALEHPERVERFAALDIAPPWPGKISLARFARFAAFASYQYVIASPVLGEQAMRRSTKFIKSCIRGGAARTNAWTEDELEHFARSFQEPDRARAAVHIYRTFLTREMPSLIADRYATHDLRIPGLALMGEQSPLTRAVGVPEPSERLRVAVVEGAGHFLAEEAPDEVLGLIAPFLRGD